MVSKRLRIQLLGIFVCPLFGLMGLWGLLGGGQVGSPAVAADRLIRPIPLVTTTPIPLLNRAVPLTTPLPTQTPFVSVTVDVVPAAQVVAVGQPLTVAVEIRDESEGCQYPIFDLTLRQAGAGTPLFRHDSPAVVGPPGPHSTVYTLTAIAAGMITFTASAYGEINCGDGWQWSYANGVSGPVTVTAPANLARLPLIFVPSE